MGERISIKIAGAKQRTYIFSRIPIHAYITEISHKISYSVCSLLSAVLLHVYSAPIPIPATATTTTSQAYVKCLCFPLFVFWAKILLRSYNACIPVGKRGGRYNQDEEKVIFSQAIGVQICYSRVDWMFKKFLAVIRGYFIFGRSNYTM